MRLRQSVCHLCLAVIASVAIAMSASAQQKPAPSPASLLIAKEIIELKGATKAFDPVIAGAINYHANLLIQTNPNLARPIREVAEKLAAELQPRRIELQQELARTYAEHFTEKELRDALAFYRSPLGKKLTEQEPKAMDAAMREADNWSRKFAEEVVEKMRAELRKRGHNLI
jgi:hypothetical protein